MLCTLDAVLVISQPLKLIAKLLPLLFILPRLSLSFAKLLIIRFPASRGIFILLLRGIVTVLQRPRVGLFRLLRQLLVAQLRLRNGFVPATLYGAHFIFQGFLERTRGKCPGFFQIAVVCQQRLFALRRRTPVSDHGREFLGRCIQVFYSGFCNVARDSKLFHRGGNVRFVCLDSFHGRAGFLAAGLFDSRGGIVRQTLLLGARKEFATVGHGALGVHVQHPVEEFVRRLPFAVLQRQFAAPEQGCQAGAFFSLHHKRFPCMFRLFASAKHLVHAAHQVLKEADFAHVICLQYGKLLRHVVRVHIPVAGQEQLIAVFAHKSQETAPFVSHPHSVEIFGAGAHHNHHPGGMKGREDVGLVHRAHLILQRDTGKEHPAALLRQAVIDFLCKQGVARALAVLICFLIADEHIERLFILRNGKDTALHLCDFFRVLAVAFAGGRVCVFQRSQIVHVLKKAVEAGAVAGGQPFMRGGVLHVLDAEATQRAAPMRLGVGFVFLYDVLVHGKRFVKFADTPEVIAAVEGGRSLLIVDAGQRHGGAAAVTGADALVLGQHDVAAAHFAFDDCHWLIPPKALFFRNFQIVQRKFQGHHDQLVSGAARFVRQRVQRLRHVFGHPHGNHRRGGGVFFGRHLKGRHRVSWYHRYHQLQL